MAGFRRGKAAGQPPRSPTRLDWRFRLLGTPVRVRPGFWVAQIVQGTLFAGLVRPGDPLLFALLWVVCSSLSLLVHEFGHALAGRWFGAGGEVELTALGGMAPGSADLP